MTETAPLRSADHNRAMHDATATITGIHHPTPHLLRFTAELPAPVAADPTWGTPNVTLRLELSADVSRVYTVRRFDPTAATIEVDVVLHSGESPMMQWAAGLRLGLEVAFRGPRQHFVIPDEPARPVALFLDATAIPALYAILAHWPERVGGVGWVRTEDAAAFAELPSVPGLELHRIETGLLERAHVLPNPEQYVVWGAGEREDMRALRSHFRSTVGLAKEHVALYGYWKRGLSNTEIDQYRLANYQRILADGGNLDDIDDLAITI
ncbi:siderophore-interacting protein [Kineosporia babensis]|uniref:Siderophore-interacting protein n=1 Tax=Kineosporia babensis TaxID=499548 RepID=A0A9X1NDV2_9ACTN|nr:siderophore-interacting protein [Kineosporia babensis]MCD5311466.1 siderophore-interacting protein [Kineosporia babensis]